MLRETERRDPEKTKAGKPRGNGRVSVCRRIAVIAVAMTAAFAYVAHSLFDLQIVNYETYRVKAENQQLQTTVIPANRGTIYDANMTVLAKSATVWDVSVSPNVISDANRSAIAEGLAGILGMDSAEILEKLNDTASGYKLIKEKVDKPVRDAVLQFIETGDGKTSYSGIGLAQNSKRYYPYGAFASAVLGFTGKDNSGLAGLEYQYDSELSGTPGRQISAKTTNGVEMGYSSDTTYYAPTDGRSLVSTIDKVVQYYTEEELKRAVTDYNCLGGGVAIVMNVKDGSILGMASEGEYDPNDPYTIYDSAVKTAVDAVTDDPSTAANEHSDALSAAQYAQWRNKAISDLYEPGSVFKIVTASAALDSGTETLDSGYTCTGSVTVAGTVLHCANLSGHGAESFAQSFVNSCNPAFITYAEAMGAATFFSYFKSFGLAEKTGIDLPGEAASMYYNANTLGEVQLASSAFGQSNKITPIQMITAAATAVNGGYLVQPHLVSKILDADGNVVKSYDSSAKRQVISSDTSAEICSLLQQAAGRAAVRGYRVGGKSGTAQILDSANADAVVSSFLAVAPCDDPQVAVLFILYEPQNTVDGYLFGGYLAAPPCGQILSNILPYLGVDKVYSTDEAETADIAVHNVVGRQVADAQVQLTGTDGLNVIVKGSGNTVVSQVPSSGTIPRNGTVTLYTDADSSAETVTVPDVTGRSWSAVSQTFSAFGLNLRGEGNADDATAVATAQDPASGTIVPVGTVVTVTFGTTKVAAD